jgi:hypothetical protein
MSIMVCGGLMQVAAQFPRPACAKEGEKPKKYAGQLKPQNAGKLHKRSPNSLSKALAAAYQPLPGLTRVSRRPCSLLRHSRARALSRLLCLGRTLGRLCTVLGTTRGGSCLSDRGIRRSGRVDGCHQRLCRRTGSYTKRSTEANRIHTIKCSRLLTAVTVISHFQITIQAAADTDSGIAPRHRDLSHFFPCMEMFGAWDIRQESSSSSYSTLVPAEKSSLAIDDLGLCCIQTEVDIRKEDTTR